MTSPVVQLRVWGVDDVLPALRRVAFGRRGLRGMPGLRFAKLLGTGSARTFTLRDADLRHWALLTVWEDDVSARSAEQSDFLRDWCAAARSQLTVTMRPLTSRGCWSGTEPFTPANHLGSETWSGPVAAITRARLRPTRMIAFWRAVPPVAAELSRQPGVRLTLGIGEAPIGLQGTFSLWDSAQQLTDFAYRSPEHVAVIRRTAAERWYAEELFARFAVLDVEGSYEGAR
ncbi:hypothetical protein [Gordonia rhizosphera]|uniref:Putative monooxygenase n=1 Tax=Gordonia rhizosphera NBRC 16068 TaxID=1108045 RepID=K6VB27_9ACTN|nr:hypothetical protein [Gordonia rhizosphera]GAB93403.1 putative monooxygenase [Gordonia rhizosphera NBRC 16068]